MAGNKFSVKRSYRAGYVGLSLRLSCWNTGTSAKLEAGADITVLEARALALALTTAADSEDAKVTSKAAAEARRQKWREREIKSGRMVVMNARQLMQCGGG